MKNDINIVKKKFQQMEGELKYIGHFNFQFK